MNIYNIIYMQGSEKFCDQVYADTMLEACAIAHVKYGGKVTNIKLA